MSFLPRSVATKMAFMGNEGSPSQLSAELELLDRLLRKCDDQKQMLDIEIEPTGSGDCAENSGHSIICRFQDVIDNFQ